MQFEQALRHFSHLFLPDRKLPPWASCHMVLGAYLKQGKNRLAHLSVEDAIAASIESAKKSRQDMAEIYKTALEELTEKELKDVEAAAKDSFVNLMATAEARLAELGFVDFEPLAHGIHAIVLKAADKSVTMHALRLSFDYGAERAETDVLIPLVHCLRLSHQQKIDITLLADESGPELDENAVRFGGRMMQDQKLWSQRVLYMLARIHHENIYEWPANEARPDNLVRFGEDYLICDPGNLNRAPEGRARENVRRTMNDLLLRNLVQFDAPDKRGIITTEFFCMLRKSSERRWHGAQRWTEEQSLHAIELHYSAYSPPLLLIVDPARKRKGPELAQDLSNAFTPKRGTENTTDGGPTAPAKKRKAITQRRRQP